MTIDLRCDLCGEPIRGNHAVLRMTVGGEGDPAWRDLHLHSEPLAGEPSCQARVTQAVEGLVEVPAPTEASEAAEGGETDLADVLPPGRALSELAAARIFTVEDCAALTELEVMSVRGVGRNTAALIEDEMLSRGLTFRSGATPVEFGRRLRRLRFDRGLTAIELAREVSEHGGVRVWEGMVRSWERGDRVPVPGRIQVLAEALGVDREVLVGPSAQIATHGRNSLP